MANSSELQALPTLKQHIALILALLRLCPNKEFTYLYGLAKNLVSNSSLHSISNEDIEYFTNIKYTMYKECKYSYLYTRSIHTGIGPRTMRWFVETQLIPLIELHIKISTATTSLKDINVTLESVENLL